VQYTKNDSTASDTSGNIIVFDVAITTPTSFPIYVAKGEEVSGGLDCTISPAGATGGTYL